jgi:hypothetical protein
MDRRRTRSNPRLWRRRSRRAQVSAVATILGLLLVVTFIANYITTTLPSQMQVNDLNHELTVENQLGRLQTILYGTSEADAIGAQISAPVSLGSAGDPPFANPDGATVSGAPGFNTSASEIAYAYSVLGALGFFPPLGFGAVNPTPPSTCTITTTTMTCGYTSAAVRTNFSLASGSSFTPSLDDGSGLMAINISTNSSSITFSNIQGFHFLLTVVGSDNTITINSNGAVTPTITVLGSNNTLALNAAGGGNTFKVLIIGNDNTVTGPGTAGDTTIYLTTYGIGNVWQVTSGGSDSYHAWFNGFNPSDVVSTQCPVGALALANSITGFTGANNAKLVETFNNSTSYNNPSTKTSTGLTEIYQSVAATTCPYVSQPTIALQQTITPGSVVVLGLTNAYIPSAEVAFDEGAVAFAQEGAYPILVDPPEFTYTGATASLWIPQFVGSIGTSSGLGTVGLTFRLLNVQTLVLPATGLALPTSGYLDLTVVSPYAQAWYNYFTTANGFKTLTTTCTPTTVCSGAFAAPEPLGTVTLAIPLGALTSLTVTTAQFSVGVA